MAVALYFRCAVAYEICPFLFNGNKLYIYIFQISKFAKTNLACFGIIVYGHFHSDKLGCNVDVVFRKTKKKQPS
jgi:hypothetical protein